MSDERDTRMFMGIMLRNLGGRIEISLDEILCMEGVSVVQWDDPITGNRVFQLQTLTTSTSGEK